MSASVLLRAHTRGEPEEDKVKVGVGSDRKDRSMCSRLHEKLP